MKVTFRQRLKGGTEFSHVNFQERVFQAGEIVNEKPLKYTKVYICTYTHTHTHIY